MGCYSRDFSDVAGAFDGRRRGHDRDFSDVAGVFDSFDGRRRRRRRDPVCTACLRFVDRVEDALDDFYDEAKCVHSCKCCKCCKCDNYWGRDGF